MLHLNQQGPKPVLDADGNLKAKVIPIAEVTDASKGMEEMSAEFRKRGSEIYQ